MKFCILTIGDVDLVKNLITAYPVDYHYLHRMIGILVEKSICFELVFLDHDDPNLKDEFELHDRLVYGYQVLSVPLEAF